MFGTYSVKATKATSGTAHQSISEAIAKGSIPQKRARVCLWWILFDQVSMTFFEQWMVEIDLQMCNWNWNESNHFHASICGCESVEG